MRRVARILAVDCGAGHVACALFAVGENGRLSLRRFAFETHGPDPEQAGAWAENTGQALRGLAREGKMHGACALAVPGNLALVKFIKAPAVERKQLPQVLQFEAAQSIPYLLSEVVWDWLEVAGDGADMEFMIAAAKTDAMEELCVAVGTANLEPELALPGVLALWQAYQYNYCDVPEDTVVIDIGARSTHLLFAGAGRFMVRTLTLAGNTITQAVADSLKLSFIEAEALKRQVMGGHTALAQGDAGGAAVAEAAELFCQRLQVEVARSLLGYGRQVPGFLPVKVLLTGGGAGVPELSMTLAEKMKLPVKPYDALRGVELCEGARANGAVAAVRYLPILVGLAAQRSLAATRPLNLLPPALRQQVSFRRQQPWWLATAALLVITWLPPWWHFYELAKSATMETTRMESRIGPWRAREADNAAKLAQLAEVRRQMDGLRGLVASKSNWLELLADLQSSLAKVEDVWLDRLQIVAEPPARDRPDEEKRPLRLELNGRLLDVSNPVAKVSPDSYARVKTLLTSFGESRFVAAVEDERFDNRQPGILQFDCTLVMNPENPL